MGITDVNKGQNFFFHHLKNASTSLIVLGKDRKVERKTYPRREAARTGKKNVSGGAQKNIFSIDEQAFILLQIVQNVMTCEQLANDMNSKRPMPRDDFSMKSGSIILLK